MCRSIEEMLKEYGEEVKREFANRMINAGKIPLEEIAEYTGLSIESVEKLASEVRK